MERVWRVLKTLTTELPRDPATPLQTHLQRLWNQALRDIPAATLTAASLTIAKLWKQPEDSLTGRWIRKHMVCTYNGVFFRPYKRRRPHDNMDKLGVHCAKWNKPGTERQIVHDPTDTMKSKIVTYLRVESKIVVIGGGGGDVSRPHSKGTDFQLRDEWVLGLSCTAWWLCCIVSLTFARVELECS